MPNPIRNRQKPFWQQVRKRLPPPPRPAGGRPGKRPPVRRDKP